MHIGDELQTCLPVPGFFHIHLQQGFLHVVQVGEAGKEGKCQPPALGPAFAAQVITAVGLDFRAVLKLVVRSYDRYTRPEIALGHADVHACLFQYQQLGLDGGIDVQCAADCLLHGEAGCPDIAGIEANKDGQQNKTAFHSISCIGTERSTFVYFKDAENVALVFECKDPVMEAPVTGLVQYAGQGLHTQGHEHLPVLWPQPSSRACAA